MNYIQDYRQSHRMPGKGRSYHGSFVQNPYRALIWNLEQRALRHLLASRFSDTPVRVLDFACGTGRIVGYFEDRVVEAVGVDVSEPMLEVAREHVKLATLLNADLTSSDVLGEKTFNLITAFRFFPNAEPELRRQAITVLRKHLDTGGYLVFNNHLNQGSLRDRISRRLHPGHVPHRMGEEEVLDMLVNTGLRVAHKYHLGIFPASEDRPLLPSVLLEPIETVLMGVKSESICRMSQYIIYVCSLACDGNAVS
jgi:SAM-dependent methyltransferase